MVLLSTHNFLILLRNKKIVFSNALLFGGLIASLQCLEIAMRCYFNRVAVFQDPLFQSNARNQNEGAINNELWFSQYKNQSIAWLAAGACYNKACQKPGYRITHCKEVNP